MEYFVEHLNDKGIVYVCNLNRTMKRAGVTKISMVLILIKLRTFGKIATESKFSRHIRLKTEVS